MRTKSLQQQPRMLLPAENNRPTQLRLALPMTGPYAGNEMGSVFL